MAAATALPTRGRLRPSRDAHSKRGEKTLGTRLQAHGTGELPIGGRDAHQFLKLVVAAVATIFIDGHDPSLRTLVSAPARMPHRSR